MKKSYSKPILWKLINVITLTLVTVSVYMETQTFIYYLEGQGLMYSPTFIVVIFLGYLPIMIMIVLMLRGFVLVRYFRLWKTTSYYKLYPMQMIVLLVTKFDKNRLIFLDKHNFPRSSGNDLALFLLHAL